MTHPELRDIGRFVLATRDAHELYRKYADFDALPKPRDVDGAKRADECAPHRDVF